jgi:foldase protein PrsA
MKKAALFVLGIAVAIAAVVVMSGCGTKVPGVPGAVATVNGQTISASEYLDQVNRRFGQDLLRSMIEQRIILQWAKEENVEPTEKQIQKQIEILKRDGSYDDQVKILGEEGLRSEIKAMQARINLAKKYIEVSDADLKKTYESMKPRYVHPARKQVVLIINQSKSKIERAAKRIKAGEDFDAIAAEYSSQQFAAFRGPIKIWVEENQTGMPPELANAAKKTKLGEISDPIPLAPPGSPTQYALLKVIQDQPKANKSFNQVKEEIEGVLLFQKSQTDPEFVKKLNAKLKAAKVDIKIDQFKNLVYTFKNPPEPPPMMAPEPQPAPKTSAKPK